MNPTADLFIHLLVLDILEIEIDDDVVQKLLIPQARVILWSNSHGGDAFIKKNLLVLFPFIYQYAGISPSCVSGGGNWQYFVTFGSGGGAGFGGGG